MKKITCILIFLFAFLMPITALADDGDGKYVLHVKNDIAITGSVTVHAGENHILQSGLLATSANGKSVINAVGNFIDLSPLTRLEVCEDIKLLEGAVGVIALTGEQKLVTGTQTAYVTNGSKVAFKVDDYGNTFNYCIEGTVKLVALRDGNEITLNKGEYVAITVKRGIRKMRVWKQNEMDDLNISFTDSWDWDDAKLVNEHNVIAVETDYPEAGLLSEVTTGNVYKITSTSDMPVSRVFYLNCDIHSANIEVYDTNMRLVAQSSRSSGNLKPNVTVDGPAGSELYIYVHSNTPAEYELYQERHITFPERLINSIKPILLPALIAVAIFLIWMVIKSKFSTKQKPKF